MMLVCLLVLIAVWHVLGSFISEDQNLDNVGISKKIKAKYRAHILVANENSPFSRREGLLFVDPEDLTPTDRNGVSQVSLYPDGNGRKVMICDNVVLLFEYGKLDYSGYRDWQLPYLLNQSRVCIAEVKTDSTVDQTTQHRCVLHFIRLLYKGTMFTYEWFNQSGISIPDSQSMALGRLQANIPDLTNSESLRYLPSILMMDGDMLITNKYLTIEDFIARVKTGLQRGFHLPSRSIHHPIEFDNVHFVIGVDGTALPAFPVNSGIMLFKPSPPVIKLHALSILIAGKTGIYRASAQGGIAYIIERLGTRTGELRNMLQYVSGMPNDRPVLSFSFENISDIKALELPRNADKYAKLLRYLPKEDDLNAYGVVVPGNWLNSWGCAFGFGKYNWNLGDWIAHFYGCSQRVIENGTCSKPSKCTLNALKTMAEYPELISTPPDINWTKVLLEGIPIHAKNKKT